MTLGFSVGIDGTQESPKETTPTTYVDWLTVSMSGPPESPWQTLCRFDPCTQMWFLSTVTCSPQDFWQSAWGTVLTRIFCSTPVCTGKGSEIISSRTIKFHIIYTIIILINIKFKIHNMRWRIYDKKVKI